MNRGKPRKRNILNKNIFSRLKNRLNNDNQSGSHEGNKRPLDDRQDEDDTPPEKIQRFELEDSNESYELPKDMADYVKKYFNVHIAEKSIKDQILEEYPIPANIDTPPKLDPYIKELLLDNNLKKVLFADQTLFNIQTSIHNIMGPLSTMWLAAEEEKQSILSAEKDVENSSVENANIIVEEKERIQQTCNMFEKVVTLVAQASQRTTFTRRSNMLDQMILDHRRAKDVLSENEKYFKEDNSGFLFGSKFEEQVSKTSKSKEQSKKVFTALAGSSSSTKNKPFPTGPLSRGSSGRGRGFRLSRMSYRGTYRGQGQRGKITLFTSSRGRHSVFSGFSSSSSLSKSSFSNIDLSSPISRKNKNFPEKLGETHVRPGDTPNGRGIHNSVQFISNSKLLSKTYPNGSGEAKVSQYRNSGNVGKRCNNSSTTLQGTISKFNLSSGEKSLRSKTSNKPEKSKFFYPIRPFQNGGITSIERNASGERLSMQTGFKRCLFFSAFAQRFAKVFEIPMGREDLPIPMPVLWVSPSTTTVYQINENTGSCDKATKWEDNSVFRRYTPYSFDQRGLNRSQRYTDISSTTVRFYDQSEEISSLTLSTDRIFGSRYRYSNNDVVSPKRKSNKDEDTMCQSIGKGKGFPKGSDPVSRATILSSYRDTSSSSSIQGYTKATDFGVKSERILRVTSDFRQGGQTRTELVDSKLGAIQWPQLNTNHSTSNYSVGCIKNRLGCSMSKPLDRRSVVKGGEFGTHQLFGIKGSEASDTDFCKVTECNIDSSPNGQHSGLSLYSKNGGHKKQKVNPIKQRDLGFSVTTWDHSYCRALTRVSKQAGRYGIAQTRQERVEIKSTDIPNAMQTEGTTRHGSVCIKSVLPGSQVLFLENGPLQQRDRRLSTTLEASPGLCLSTVLPDRSGLTKVAYRESQIAADNASMADTSLVPKTTANVNKKPYSSATITRPPKGPIGKQPSTDKKLYSQISGMDCVRKSLFAEGISEESAKLIIQARRGGTRSHYESAWGKWCSWCSERQISPTGCSLNHILQFLTELFHKGLEYSTISGYRSAISAYHDICDGSSIGKHPRVTALLKGIYNQNPPKPKYSFIWDVEQVLSFLSSLPNDN